MIKIIICMCLKLVSAVWADNKIHTRRTVKAKTENYEIPQIM